MNGEVQVHGEALADGMDGEVGGCTQVDGVDKKTHIHKRCLTDGEDDSWLTEGEGMGHEGDGLLEEELEDSGAADLCVWHLLATSSRFLNRFKLTQVKL